MTNLQMLDLHEASIIDGGASYYQDYITSENKIGSYFFMEGNNIKNIELPDNIEVIESYAFSGCTNLISICIPGSTTEVKCDFYGCNNLSTIKIANGTTPLILYVDRLPNITTLYVDRQVEYRKGVYYEGKLPSSLRSLYIGKNVSTIKGEYSECKS